MAKSLLRYPGGKYKAVKFIKPIWNQIEHHEYREPFVGGGSVFIAKPSVEFNWINDIDSDVIAFYKILSNEKSKEELIDSLLNIEISKKHYDELYYSKPRDNFNRARRYYFINRTSFSGIMRWNSFIGDVRYNIESAQHLMRKIGEKLSKYKITSIDFEKIITAKSKEKKVFMYLDPPYSESRQIVAYNKPFSEKDHLRLAKVLKKTNHPFLLTYDDTKFIRELYDWAYQQNYTWTYSVANSRIHHNPREAGNELFISNFKIKNYVTPTFDIK